MTVGGSMPDRQEGDDEDFGRRRRRGHAFCGGHKTSLKVLKPQKNLSNRSGDLIWIFAERGCAWSVGSGKFHTAPAGLRNSRAPSKLELRPNRAC